MNEVCSTCGLFLKAFFCPACGEVNCQSHVVTHAQAHVAKAELFKLAASADRFNKIVAGVKQTSVELH